MAQYACPDCDATFTAPTDTETVCCPGCGQMVEQQPDPSFPPDQPLRDRIAKTLAGTALKPPWPHCLAMADAVMPVLHSLTLRELEQLARPNTPPSRPEPRIPDHTVNEEEAPTVVRQRADCTELEWAEQERARFERLYTHESLRADLAEQRADTAARDADIYQQRLERLSDGYTRERKRAEEAEAHRLALSEALGLGTGAPWEAIHDRATELGLPPLAEDPVAQRLGLVPASADRAAVLLWAADQIDAETRQLKADEVLEPDKFRPCRDASAQLRRLAAEAQQEPALDPDPQPVSEEFLQHLATARVREDDGAEAQQPEEEAELVCVDECGNCDACGMEPFGTPAEGWREAARFLRRTPRDSTDFPGALRGARLIEDELRRRAEAQQPDTETPELPYTHIDDDGDKLTVGTTMAGTLDGEAPVVTLDIDGTGGGVVYVRPERVEEVVAALRAAGRAAGVPAVPVESAAADTSEETCDGCGHTPHLADQCQSFTFNERCACDEPLAIEEA